MSPATAVVTGASGYLGRVLVAKLSNLGVRVRGISRSSETMISGAESVRAEITNAKALSGAMHGADVVFHLAAHAHDVRSRDDSFLQRSVTFGGTIASLIAAEQCRVGHFIFASSLAVHGRTGRSVATEDDPCNPQTFYGQAKLEAELAVRDFAARTGARAACIRPAMIYGLECPGNLGRMIRAVRRRTFPPIPEFGNRRSMVAVDDVADAMILAWKADVAGGRPFILTDGEAYSTRQIYEMIRASLGRGEPMFSVPRLCFTVAARLGDSGGAVIGRRLPFDSNAMDRLIGSALFSHDRARRELGFAPTVTLRDVLPAMVQMQGVSHLAPRVPA